MVEAQCLNPHNMGGTEFDKICKVATVAVLREFKVHTDSYAHLECTPWGGQVGDLRIG